MLVVVAKKRCNSRRRLFAAPLGQFNSTFTVRQGEREQEQRLLQGIGAVEELCRIYRASFCLSRTSLASATVVSAPQQSIGTVVPYFKIDRRFNRHVNRKRSAVRHLQGLGTVGNPCRIYRASFSLSCVKRFGLRSHLNSRSEQSFRRFNRKVQSAR